MDEIEYLEEYEDLILPTMSTQAASTKGRSRTNLVSMADDDDSSSIDQDIFDSLFDDNSDDESVMHKKGPAKLSQRSERSSRISRVSMDSLDMLVKELGEPFNPNAEGSKSTNRATPKQNNIKVTLPNKIVQKSSTTTTMAKGSSPTPVSSGSSKPINKVEIAKAIAERNIKAKSVATVRPTVQQNLGTPTASAKSMHANDHTLPTTRILQNSKSSGLQNSKITSGSVNSTKVASPTPSTSRKQISAATSTTGSNNSNLHNSSKNNTPASKRIVERSQTTIIKPEKPQIKDPAEDPLSLENIENDSDSDTDSFIYSDVSADTFVTLSDVDYEERNIIDLSNDSNYERANLDKIRGSTPSPTVSDDYKSDKEDSPTKMLSKFDERSKDGSALESNANATAKFRVRQYIDAEATTSRQRKQETPSSTHDKSMNMQINATAKDTLLERIESVLSTSSENEEDLQVVQKHNEQVEPDMEVEVVTANKDEDKEKKYVVMPDNANACDSQVDDTTIAKQGVIQEPSTNDTMDMDMREIVEEVVEKVKINLDNLVSEKTVEESAAVASNDSTTNDIASNTNENNVEDVAMLECNEKDEHTLITTENIDESLHEMEVASEQIVETVANAETNENLITNTEESANETEVETVDDVAVTSIINKTPIPCEDIEKEEEYESEVVKNTKEAQEKLAETKIDSGNHGEDYNVNNKNGDHVNSEDLEREALAENSTEVVKSDPTTGEETSKDLQSDRQDEKCNITDVDTTTTTEETDQNQKYENINKSAHTENENEQDCATRSKNAKELHEEKVAELEHIKKMRGADKQRISLRRSRTPTSAKLTETKSKNYALKPTEKSVSSKASHTAEDISGDDALIKDAEENATVMPKADKLDEDFNEDEMPQHSRSKSNTDKVDNEIDDNKKVLELEKTKSQTQRKSRHDKKEDALSTERSQTPRGRKLQKKLNVVNNDVSEIEKIKEKEEDKTTNETKEDAPLKSEDEAHLKKCKTNELQVNEQITSRPDKRVRGLVVSLKKTDLSKVLNEKLLRKINTQPNDLKEGETAANITVDKAEMDSKGSRKGGSKERTPTAVEEIDAGVEKSAEERSKDLKSEETTEKAKEDSKHDKHKDKSDTSRKDEKSGESSKRYSKYETHRSRSRQGQTDDRSVEKPNEAEHSSKHDKSVIKEHKDSRFEKSPDNAKRYSKTDKSTERSRRDAKYERSADRAKKYLKEEKHTEKSKTDSRESIDTAKQSSKEESETVKKESREKTEYKTKRDAKDEQSRKKKGSNEGKSPEKSRSDSKEHAVTTKNSLKEEKPEDHTERHSKEDGSEDLFKNKSEESTQRTKKSSKDEKAARLSRYEKTAERAKNNSKEENTELKEDIDSKEKKTKEEASIDMSSRRSSKVSKEKGSSDSKDATTSAPAEKNDSKEGNSHESKDEKSTEITGTILEEENPVTKSEEKVIDYRKMKWKNEKYTRKTKSVQDNKEMPDSEVNTEKETLGAADETKQPNESSLMETETGDMKTAEQNTPMNEKLSTESSVDPSKIDSTQNCVEESDSKLEETTVETDPSHDVNTSQIEHPINEVTTEVQLANESVDNIQKESCESHEVNESIHEESVVYEEREEPTESVGKTENEEVSTECTENAVESTNRYAERRRKKGRFLKIRNKKVKRKPASGSSDENKTAQEEESVVENSEKEPETETELESSDKAEQGNVENPQNIGNVGEQTDATIEKEDALEPSVGKTASDVILESGEKLETQIDTHTVDESSNLISNEEVVLEVATLNVAETVETQTNAGTLEEALKTTEGDIESIDRNSKTVITSKAAKDSVAKNVDAETVEADESSNKNETSKIKENIIQSKSGAATQNKVKNITENAEHSNNKELPTQQTPTTREDAVESAKEDGSGSSSGTAKMQRNKHLRTFADSLIITQTQQLQSADEDDNESATRRSMRTRAADHSPFNKNENHKKSSKVAANQTPSSSVANSSQKIQKEQPHNSRSFTATPTTYVARKRMRDNTPNTTAENSDQEKSPSKKPKWESARKISRLHNDDVDTSEGEHEAAAVTQRAGKHLSGRENSASKSTQDKHGKITVTKDAKGGGKGAQESVAAKQSTSAEVKQSVTGDNLNTSKKSLNVSHGASKAETPEVKRKPEHDKLQTGTGTSTTTTTDANKKRRVELEGGTHAVKKHARANDEDTRQKQSSTTHKSAAKQSANSCQPGTSTTATEHAHASTTGGSADPLHLPVKRFRRLQAIDGYDTLNISEEGKVVKGEVADNKSATYKRKSLRPVAPTDDSKSTETTQKSTAKQTQPIQQQQQQQHKGAASKSVEPTTLSLKDRKIVVPNKSAKNAVNTDKSSNKSPTKSPGSKVITFKEWLEQQKKSNRAEGGEEVLFEPDESAIRMDKILTATTSEQKRSNTSASEVSTSANQKPREPTTAQKPATAAAEASVSKDTKKKLNLRDAPKRKRDAAFITNNEKPQSGAHELAKQTPPAAKQGRIEKVLTTATTPAGAHFKRPSLPQRQPPRHTPSRLNSRTPTAADAKSSLHGTQQHARQATLQRLDTKVKLRKLRVRINRSTVAAYFKNLHLSNIKEQVLETPISITELTADIPLESGVKSTESLQNLTTPRDPLLLPTRSVSTTTTKTTTTPQLPTLTARPTVLAASESNDAVKSLPAAMPALTKVPPSVQEKPTKKSQEKQVASRAAEVPNRQFGSNEELSLLTPMKSVTTAQSANNSSLRTQQQQQKQQIPTTAPEVVHEKRTSTASSSDTSTSQRTQFTIKPTNSSSSSTITAASSASNNDTQLPFTPVVPKEELPDEQILPTTQKAATTAVTAATSADNATSTNSLTSRTLAIAAATNSALNQAPTNDASGYYGLTPTQLDSNGTRLYSFLHPAKYNRNHGCVLLDYCCPNLDGPMPAIDPTRIHAQVQAGVRELPAYIVMTTKLITRADLEANKNVIPASIRQKVEKITADASNASANHATAANVSGAPNVSQAGVPAVLPPTVPVSKTAPASLTPTITALQKHLPSTTIITPKLMPATSSATMTAQGTSPTSQLANVSDYQRSLLRTSVRQFDARLKKYYYRIAMLSFSERQTIIDGIINSTNLTPKDIDCAVRLIDEYAAQIGVMPTTSAQNAANPTKTTTPAIQSVSKAITTQTTNTVVRTTTIQQQVQKHNSQSSKNQVAVLDKDNSLLGYQLAASPMPMSKSTISTRSSIMSSSITGTTNTSLPNATTTTSGGFPTLKATQDSPRIFYTKTPMQTSTPIATTTGSGGTPQNDVNKPISRRGTPRMARDMTIRQIPQKLSALPVTSTTATATPPNPRRLPTLTRNPHLNAGSSSAEKNNSDTITTRSAVTIANAPKRMTRATAAAKVIVITQNSDGQSVPLEECILPDGHENTEIKRERADDEFVGGN